HVHLPAVSHVQDLVRPHDVRMPSQFHPHVPFSQKPVAHLPVGQILRVKRLQCHRPATVCQIGTQVHRSHPAPQSLAFPRAHHHFVPPPNHAAWTIQLLL